MREDDLGRNSYYVTLTTRVWKHGMPVHERFYLDIDGKLSATFSNRVQFSTPQDATNAAIQLRLTFVETGDEDEGRLEVICETF